MLGPDGKPGGKQTRGWLCLMCKVPQFGNLRRHERERCIHKHHPQHKGFYPMNAYGTDIERDITQATYRQLQRLRAIDSAHDTNDDVYKRIHNALKSSQAEWKRFQNMSPQKWHDTQVGCAERCLRFFIVNLVVMRPDRFHRKWAMSAMDDAVKTA